MSRSVIRLGGTLFILSLLATISWSQWGERRGYRDRNLPSDRAGVPNWDVEAHRQQDVFTFVRLEYDSSRGGWGRRGSSWATDWPDSDLNFSYRLQQLTSLKVNPDPIHLRITDAKLFDHPFVYMIEPGSLRFSETEVQTLRRYLFNGGFLMVDDFWGDYEWQNFENQMRRVFPKRNWVELDLDHEIFHCVYNLSQKPQVPSIDEAWYGRSEGRTWESERRHGPGTKTVHYRAYFDDQGRMMALICHNTDLGDGWEREGEAQWYFSEFSEKKAYPMGINIVTYAMTH